MATTVSFSSTATLLKNSRQFFKSRSLNVKHSTRSKAGKSLELEYTYTYTKIKKKKNERRSIGSSSYGITWSHKIFKYVTHTKNTCTCIDRDLKNTKKHEEKSKILFLSSVEQIEDSLNICLCTSRIKYILIWLQSDTSIRQKKKNKKLDIFFT